MLKKLLYKRDKYLLVDWDYLKSSYEDGRLQGSTVFARIFDIVDDELFAIQNKNEYDLTPYDVYIEDWILLYSFIRNGYIPNTYDVEKNLSELNFCYDLCIKLGGIPEFEKYYDGLYGNSQSSQTDNSGNVYNPMIPIDDVRGLYTWRIVTSYTPLNAHESVTTCLTTEPVTVFYCRRPKNE